MDMNYKIIGNGLFQIELYVAYLNTKKGVMMLKKIPNSEQDRKVGLDFPMLSSLILTSLAVFLQIKKNPISISKKSYSKVDCHLLVVKQHLLKNPTWHYYLGILYQIYIYVLNISLEQANIFAEGEEKITQKLI